MIGIVQAGAGAAAAATDEAFDHYCGAICRGIADAHRAALWAEPGPAGVGTAFVLRFPALAGAPLLEATR